MKPEDRDIYERIVKVVRGLSGESVESAAKVLRIGVERAGYRIEQDPNALLQKGKDVKLRP